MCSARAVLGLGLALGLAAALALGNTDCAPVLCTRNSDCPTGQICTVTGGCANAPDAAGDGAAGDDAGAAVSDAAGADAAVPDDASGAGSGAVFHEAAPWPP